MAAQNESLSRQRHVICTHLSTGSVSIASAVSVSAEIDVGGPGVVLVDDVLAGGVSKPVIGADRGLFMNERRSVPPGAYAT